MAVARSQFSDESRLLPFRLESGEDAANDVVLMADAPYLVALALVEQEGRRALPLTGRSLPAEAVAAEPTTIAHALALELLLRLWQRSDEGALQRACGVESLLLVELPMEALPEALPTLKAAWLNSGCASVTWCWMVSAAGGRGGLSVTNRSGTPSGRF